MATQAVAQGDLLSRFEEWSEHKLASLFPEQSAGYQNFDYTERVEEAQERQSAVFAKDLKRHVRTFSNDLRYELLALSLRVVAVVMTPLAALGEFLRACGKSITASECLQNLSLIPIRVFTSATSAIWNVFRAVDKFLSIGPMSVGLLAWHNGERLVRAFSKTPDTVLSNTPRYRDVVYDSIGTTLLAAAALVFIPIAPIQMLALPVIFGSIYGTINNQFTVRECPEYYTMGHDYDGTRFKGHAIKTNNLLIKPFVTGCYATTMVTKIMGLVLSAAGTLPFAAAALPVSYAAAMIAGSCAIALVVSHIFSKMAKQSLQTDLEAYAKLIGIQWTESMRNQTWSELASMRHEREEERQRELTGNPQQLAHFQEQLERLTESIDSKILSYELPIKYVTGWTANNERNLTGYVAAGAGTLACMVGAVFLRVVAL